CDFRHICLPDEESEQINIESDEELVELLEKRESLKDAAKEFDKVDKKLKEYWKKMEVGTLLIGGKFQVKIITYARTVYNVPDVVKEPYKGSAESRKATITAVE
ncbi:MAG: SNARE domain-containing protein, partial [Planctomycetota bacterium]